MTKLFLTVKCAFVAVMFYKNDQVLGLFCKIFLLHCCLFVSNKIIFNVATNKVYTGVKIHWLTNILEFFTLMKFALLIFSGSNLCHMQYANQLYPELAIAICLCSESLV